MKFSYALADGAVKELTPTASEVNISSYNFLEGLDDICVLHMTGYLLIKK